MVSDTIDLRPAAEKISKIEVISLAKIFAQAISRTFSGESLSALFD
jgi:phosphoribosylpyrophosphate synthetase